MTFNPEMVYEMYIMYEALFISKAIMKIIISMI